MKRSAVRRDIRRALERVLPVVDARGRAVGMLLEHDLRAYGL